MINIESLDNELITDYIKLKKLENHVILDGKKVIDNYLKKHDELESIFVTDTFFQKNKEYCESLDTNTYVAKTELVNKIIGYKFHNGVMAKVKLPSYQNISNIKGSCLVLNGISGPENVGMIARNCKAFGIENLVFDEKSADPYMRRCIRVSIGHIFSLNIFRTNNITRDLKNYELIGTSVNGSNISRPSNRKKNILWIKH